MVHAEALPSIDTRHLLDIGRDEIAHCLWRAPRRMMGGNGRFSWQSTTTIACAYELTRGLPGHEIFEDSIVLQLIHSRQKEDRKRWWLECPECSIARRFLYFVAGNWRCRQCHGLGYASQRMGASVRQTLRFRELEAKIANGRPKGMHQRKYLAIQAETERLRRLACQFASNRDPLFASNRDPSGTAWMGLSP